jgi:NADH-quinone oxidoreductase subunit N
MMMLVMFSMIGFPPMAGFYAKWWVLAEVINAGHIGLAITGIVFSVIGAFYYLRIVKLMYFDDAVDSTKLVAPADMRFVLSLNGLVILALGVFPDGLIAICNRAFG